MVTPPRQIQDADLDKLYGLLNHMDACARNIEQITEHEREAARNFDAESLMQLSELRGQSYQALIEMENQCRKLLVQYDAPEDMSLRVFIDLFAACHAHELQALRRSLYTRMMHIDKISEDSRIHLKAAYDVTIGVLQHIGAVEPKQTYGPGRSA